MFHSDSSRRVSSTGSGGPRIGVDCARMNRFLAGLIIGAALAGASLYGYAVRVDGCLSRCGDGTRCDAHRCVIAVVDAGPAAVLPTKESRRRKRAAGGAGGSTDLKAAA